MHKLPDREKKLRGTAFHIRFFSPKRHDKDNGSNKKENYFPVIQYFLYWNGKSVRFCEEIIKKLAGNGNAKCRDKIQYEQKIYLMKFWSKFNESLMKFWSSFDEVLI